MISEVFKIKSSRVRRSLRLVAVTHRGDVNVCKRKMCMNRREEEEAEPVVAFRST